MWRFYVRETEGGFSLIEMVVVVLVVGILAAIAAPRFLGMYSRTRVNQTLVAVQGALQESQRQAMRSSTPCNLALNASPPGVTGACLTTGNRSFSRVALRTSATTMRFNIKGSVSNTDGSDMTQPITVVVSSPNTNMQRCLVMSVPLGVIRTGVYSGTGTAETSCVSRNGRD
jgi:prepilin-type N-terminal cleavage/methylation domain-containing protein